ncbi:ORF923 [White spot syndrome virus]|uniref:ORF923 n=1 Tax=White spot syndrome virus TaxID=342409 RepID=A0A2D3I5V7_9VIRU|nr:ORF923 [White spot syndrome virus]
MYRLLIESESSKSVLADLCTIPCSGSVFPLDVGRLRRLRIAALAAETPPSFNKWLIPLTGAEIAPIRPVISGRTGETMARAASPP